MHISLIVFDVNETLLDLQALDPVFERMLGDKALRRAWFAELLRTTLLTNLLGGYLPFDVLAGHALDTVARMHGKAPGLEARAAILAGLRTLPAHTDVRPALDRLHSAGFQLACLTNSSPQTAQAQMNNAGLDGYFHAILSVDAVRRYKPAMETYHMVADHFGIAPAEMCMVAAHDWDVAGALQAGCQAAFVIRPGLPRSAVLATPNVITDDLISVANRIICAVDSAPKYNFD